MNKTFLAIACLLLGAGGGYFVGSSSAPAPTAPRTTSESAPEKALSAGGEWTSSEPGHTLTPKASKQEPLTAATLRTELESLEAGGYFGMQRMKDYAALQERLMASDLPSLAAEFCNNAKAGGHDSGIFLVLGTYAESDPQAAWNLALSVTNPSIRQNALMAVLGTIASKDPTRALALVDTVKEPQLKQQIRSMALSGLARQDPERALKLALDGTTNNDGSLFMIFNQWGRKDPEAAKAAVAKLSGRQGDQARQALVSTLAQQDPVAAWMYANTLPATSGNGYSDPRVQVIQSWAQSDPQAALKAAQTISEGAQRSMAMGMAVNAWAGTDFSAALNYAISVDDPAARGTILQQMSQNPNGDRKALLQAVMEHVPPGDTFQQAISGVFSSWARDNPAAAAAAAMSLPAGRAFSNVASQIASQWMSSSKNKQEVFDWARNLPPGEARSNSLRSVFSSWSNDNPEAASRVLSSLAGEDRSGAVQAVASSWAQRSPSDALKWSSTLTDASERGDAVRSIISRWAGNDPQDAARYAAAMPEAERGRAMEAAIGSWASKDTESAATWLDKQPTGPSKDGALRSLARKVAQEDPEAALTWVAGLSDEKDRSRQTEQIARDWVRQDPSTAKTWIERSNLPQPTKDKLLK